MNSQQPYQDVTKASIAEPFIDTEHPVKSVIYGVHTKRGGNEHTPKTLRVEYESNFNQWHKEWVCIEHQGFARKKAELWWKERSHHPCPKTAGEAMKLARQGVLAEPTHITVRETAGEDFPRIIAWRLGEKPAMREPGADEDEKVLVSAVQCDEEDAPPF